MRKKFLSLALVAVLCLSMAVPAVAASPPKATWPSQPMGGRAKTASIPRP